MKRPILTCITFAAFLVTIVYGVTTVFTYERSSSDWGLLSGFWGLFQAIFYGGIGVVLLSLIAILRKEKYALSTLFISIPCLCFVLLVSFSFVSSKIKRKQELRDEQQIAFHHKQLMSNPSILGTEDWPNDGSPRGRALRGIFWGKQGQFKEQDFLRLVKNHPSWLETVYCHPNCPKKLLQEGFTNYKSQPKPLPLKAYFQKILRNPNSPVEYAEEVSRWEGLSEMDRWTVEKILEQKNSE